MNKEMAQKSSETEDASIDKKAFRRMATIMLTQPDVTAKELLKMEEAIKRELEDQKKEPLITRPNRRLCTLSCEKCCSFTWGVIASGLLGAVFPLFAPVFANALIALNDLAFAKETGLSSSDAEH